MGVSEQIRPSAQGRLGEAGVFNPFYKPTDVLVKFDKITKQFVSGVTYYSTPLGYRWSDGLFMYSGMTAGLPPNQASCMATPDASGGYFLITPTSHHTGGVNVCFMDGAVRFVSETVDTDSLGSDFPAHVSATGTSEMDESPFGVWGAISTRASGESKSF
jgi:prepilin-type processing-associated H-X9-DG protein